MSVDLDGLSKEELKSLKANVDKALESVEVRKRADALKAAREAARQHGYSLEELLEAAPKKAKGLPKYANPADPTQTWTGRGRKPNWLNEALAAGKSLDDLAI